MMNLEVISEEIIKPSQSTPPHLINLKASLFGNVSSPILAPLLLFFSNKITPTTSAISVRLIKSLPTALSLFYPLSGRIQDADNITCNDEGVPYVQTQVRSSCLSEIVHKADMSLLDKLLPSFYSNGGEGSYYSDILMAIQVNTFSCGGIAIGIRINHAISDAFSIVMFLKTWTSISKGETPNSCSPLPYFQLWKQYPAHPPQDNISEELNPGVLKNVPVCKWFVFSKDSCNALRSRFCSDYNHQNRPSITLVLSAFICSRIKLACKSGFKYNNNIPHEVFQVVNIRPKVKTLPKPYYYFGNMVVSALARPTENGHKSLCNSYLACMEKSVEKILRGHEFVEGIENGIEDFGYIKEHFKRKSKGELVSIGFSSLRSLPLYEPDFGWGKPVWVTSSTSVYKDFVILIPASASSDDTFAFVNLSIDEMAKLEADNEFLSFASKSATVVNSKL